MFISLLFVSCNLFNWDDGGDYSFSGFIINSTKDTLNLVLKNEHGIVGFDTVLFPASRVFYAGGREVNKEDDISDFLFRDSYDDSYTVKIFAKENLVVHWSGLASYMGDTIHHFYNYDSWDIELINNEYLLEFTIYETDFEN